MLADACHTATPASPSSIPFKTPARRCVCWGVESLPGAAVGGEQPRPSTSCARRCREVASEKQTQRGGGKRPPSVPAALGSVPREERPCVGRFSSSSKTGMEAACAALHRRVPPAIAPPGTPSSPEHLSQVFYYGSPFLDVFPHHMN